MAQIAEAEIGDAQQQFVEMMTDIERIAGHVFKRLSPADREEAVAEAVAQCWQNHLHCVAAKKKVKPSSMAYYAVQGVKSGQSLSGTSSTDVLARRTQMLGRASVRSLDSVAERCAGDAGGPDGGDWSEALVDKRIWERPPERARLKLDYGQFLSLPELTEQERATFEMLAEQYRTSEMAERLGVSAPRVCQVKGSVGRKLVDFFGASIQPDWRAL